MSAGSRMAPNLAVRKTHPTEALAILRSAFKGHVDKPNGAFDLGVANHLPQVRAVYNAVSSIPDKHLPRTAESRTRFWLCVDVLQSLVDAGAGQLLSAHQWKASTVLSGSVIEAFIVVGLLQLARENGHSQIQNS